MRIELNLASRPARNERRFFVLAGTAAALLLAVAFVLGITYARDWWRGRDLARQTERLRGETARLDAEQKRLEQDLRKPQARDVLDRAYFINSLILQKSVSWTMTFMELEKIIPDRVQVASLRPEVMDNNQVRLEMTVAGENFAHLLEFVRRLENSDKFEGVVLGSETPPAQGALDASTRLALGMMYEQK